MKKFCLPDENGKKFCLNDIKNKWIILYFYPKDNTSGCTIEAIDFSKKMLVFEKMNTIVIGVSPDSSNSHLKFIQNKKLRIKLLSDEKKEVLKKYNVWKLKKMYGREYYGVERSTFLINPKGEIVFEWRKVKVKDHVKKVFEKIKELNSK